MTKFLRQIWHDLFYNSVGEKHAHLALTCKEATDLTDLDLKKASLRLKLRFWLHLSVCQICKNYFEFAKLLRKTLKADLKKIKDSDKTDIKQLNDKLLKDFTSTASE